MKNSITAVALIAAAMSPAAFAEKTVEIEFSFNRADIVDAASAAETLAEFETQAEAACSYRQPITGVELTDQACVAEAVAEAVKKVGSDALSAAYEADGGNVRVAQIG